MNRPSARLGSPAQQAEQLYNLGGRASVSLYPTLSVHQFRSVANSPCLLQRNGRNKKWDSYDATSKLKRTIQTEITVFELAIENKETKSYSRPLKITKMFARGIVCEMPAPSKRIKSNSGCGPPVVSTKLTKGVLMVLAWTLPHSVWSYNIKQQQPRQHIHLRVYCSNINIHIYCILERRPMSVKPLSLARPIRCCKCWT